MSTDNTDNVLPWPLDAAVKAASDLGAAVVGTVTDAAGEVAERAVDAVAEASPVLKSEAERAAEEERKRKRREKAEKVGRQLGTGALLLGGAWLLYKLVKR